VKFLLDTCAVSELISKSPNAGVIAWLNGQDPDRLFLSAITIGEIQRGISRLPDSDRARQLQEWLNDELLISFDRRIIPLDTHVLQSWGILTAGLEKLGVKLPVADSLIAATAIALNCTIVARNVRDFDKTGVRVLNPWI
jgi:predicted nucleic acid-binding protein